MPRCKRGVVELRKRAINSLVLAIELFNRPHDSGRSEGVLIFLHHSFELLLKAIILNKTGTIHEKRAKYSYGFDKCLEILRNILQAISIDERTTLSILDAHRDTAVHFYQEISEDLLYIQAQASATLFDDLLRREFCQSLSSFIPPRVLPISTNPPRDIQLLIDNELSQVDELLKLGSRKGSQAAARLRPVLSLATASRETSERMSEKELRKVLTQRRRGDDWSVILPELAQLRFDTEGEGIPFNLRIRSNARLAVRVVKDGEPAEGTVIKHEVNIWDKFNLGLNSLAKKLDLTAPKTGALLIELGIKDNPECYKVLRRGSINIKGYSKKTLDILKAAIDSGLDVDDIWKKHRSSFGYRGR